MKVRVLGTAAGGGLPQWNCGCTTCQGARAQGVQRTQDCLAVSGDGTSWYLFNASADLRAQLQAHPQLWPHPGTRDSPLRAVLLTSAELDHTIGLLSLREAPGLTVYATATVRAALPFTAALAAYTDLRWHIVRPGVPIDLDATLAVTPFAAGSKRPRYATEDAAAEWTVAYRITDTHTGGVLVYAPGLAAVTGEFVAGVGDAQIVLLDGTFADDQELAPRDISAMGHLPVADCLPLLPTGPRFVYTHLNNTNPLGLRGTGSLRAHLDAAGARIAEDGELFEL